MKKLIFAIVVFTVLGCNDKNELPDVSNLTELLEFELEATSGFLPYKTYIDSANSQIQVFSNSDFKESDFPMTLKTKIIASAGATVSPASGTGVTFNDMEDFSSFTITSESGKTWKEYTFSIRDNQIPNAGFENWVEEIGMNGKPFMQPGKHLESTVWATTNMGTSIYSIYGTSPIKEGDNTLVKIETVTTAALPLVAGGLYLGKFDLDAAMMEPTNAAAAALLGIPFFGKPKEVQFSYSFKGGEQLIQAELKDPGNLFGGFNVYNLEGRDKYKIEAVLEKRVGDKINTIAKASFEDDEDTDTFSTLKLPFQYFTNDEPTHFYISFSPSLDGGTYKGAIGSTLIVDDVRLLY